MKKRREILESMGLGSVALMAAMTPAHAQSESLAPQPPQAPQHHIRFGVCGISHDHIHGMIGAVERGGGELVSYWGAEPDKLAVFAKRYPKAKQARSQDEVLQDSALQLVMSSHIANERAGIGVRAMKAGKDFLADKPGITTLKDLALVRKTIAETGRIYAILLFGKTRGARRGPCRGADQAGRHRQGDPDHQSRAASGDPACR
jgi:hypothetical protein